MKRDLFGLFMVVVFLVILFAMYDKYNTNKIAAPVEVNTVEFYGSEGLHPTVEQKTNELITDAAKIGITVIITDGYRSYTDQDQLYGQGREQPGKIVTHARGGQSMHNFGLAIDFALKTDSGKIIWDIEYDGNNNGESDWFEVAQIAKELGFSWGGDWKRFKDYPHLEMTFDHNLNQLQSGILPDSY